MGSMSTLQYFADNDNARRARNVLLETWLFLKQPASARARNHKILITKAHGKAYFSALRKSQT